MTIPVQKSGLPERNEWIFRTTMSPSLQLTLKERPDDIDGNPRQGITLWFQDGQVRVTDKHIAELLLIPVVMGANKLTLLPQREAISGNAA